MVRTHAVVNEVLDDRAQLHRLKKELTVRQNYSPLSKSCDICIDQELKERQRRIERSPVDLEELSRLEQEKAEICGKVQELEATRQEQEARIERLKKLVVQGGDTHDAEVGKQKRRRKRVRETWCPGEITASFLPAPLSARGKVSCAHQWILSSRQPHL